MMTTTYDDDRFERILWTGHKIDRWTGQALEDAQRFAGRPITLTQGSWSTAVGASAGTHSQSGVIDAVTGDRPDILVAALRRAGFAAWLRTAAEGPWKPHIHAVLIGHPDLAPAAARQVTAYLAGRNGLATNGADTGPRDHVGRVHTYRGIPRKAPTMNRVQYARKLLTAALAELNHVTGRPHVTIARQALTGILRTMPKA